MAAMFNQDFSVIPREDYDKIYTEFIDLSGIGATKQYEIMTKIHNINCRLIVTNGLIDNLRGFVSEFGMPFVPAIEDLRKYGHRLVWIDGNEDGFMKQLVAADMKERRYIADLDYEKKRLKDLHKDGVPDDSDGRKNFIKRLNNLGKFGYRIDKDKTTVEELALMIKDYDDEEQTKPSKKS